MAIKLPYKRWKSSDAFPPRKLYLDLLWQPDEDDEEGLKYRFSFLTDTESSENGEGGCWYPVGQVLSLENAGPAMNRWLNETAATGTGNTCL